MTVSVVWAGLRMARAASLGQLPVKHRAAPLDILSGLPVATPDMFMWTSPDGSYRFGLQGTDQWRVESRSPDGTVKGRYFYRTPEGKTVDVSYDAGPQGYRARGDAIPGGAAPPLHQQRQLQQQQHQQQQQDERVNNAFGALLLTDVKETLPFGEGISTFVDDNTLAIVTDVKLHQAPRRPTIVFPIAFLPGSHNEVAGPPLIDNMPVLPGAIPF